jgi:hypothetical protein
MYENLTQEEINECNFEDVLDELHDASVRMNMVSEIQSAICCKLSVIEISNIIHQMFLNELASHSNISKKLNTLLENK